MSAATSVSVPSAGVKPKNQLFLFISTGEKRQCQHFNSHSDRQKNDQKLNAGLDLAFTLRRFFWLQRAEASITTPSISTPFSLTLCVFKNKIYTLLKTEMHWQYGKWRTVSLELSKPKEAADKKLGLLDLLNCSQFRQKVQNLLQTLVTQRVVRQTVK